MNGNCLKYNSIKKIICLSALISVILILLCKWTYADEGFEVHFIDVGQADAALIICDNEAMLIDGGNSEDSQLIFAYLKNLGISHLKYIIATHLDEDHIGGLAGALNYADAETAYCSTLECDTKAFNSFVKYLGDTSLTIPESGTQITLGSACGIVLAPLYEGSDSNNNSIVIRIVYGDTSFLFMGDAEEEEEQSILKAYEEISSDVIKIGHHGSSSSTSFNFLQAVSPEFAVISCGEDNTYGHPSETTLETIKECGVVLYRTDKQGDIICYSDGTDISFETEKNTVADNIWIPGTVIEEQDSRQINEVKNDQEIYTYVLNKNSKIIHTMDCNSVKKMSEKNKLEITGNLNDIMSEYSGYRVCGNCHAQY